MIAYEFFVHDKEQLRGPLRLSVNKSTGLPLCLDMKDKQLPGSMTMDYSYDNIGEIEIPACIGR